MARVLFSLAFLDDAEMVYSHRLKKRLESVLSMIESFPDSGTRIKSKFLASKYGDEARVCNIEPFYLVYSYDREADTVYIHGLIPQRSVH